MQYVCGSGCRSARKKGESIAEYHIFAHEYTHVQCKWMLKTKRIVAQMNRKETITSYNGACTRMFLHSEHRPHTLSKHVSSHESIFHCTESKVFGKSSHIKETDRAPPIRKEGTDSQWNHTYVICMHVYLMPKPIMSARILLHICGRICRIFRLCDGCMAMDECGWEIWWKKFVNKCI